MSEIPAPRHFRIFLSSPGDVADERGLAMNVIDQLPYDPPFSNRVTLQVVAWDRPRAGVPMLVTMTPQEAIDQELLQPSQCDIVVVIFWSRMGTPLSSKYAKPDGRPYWSGTEWEYHDAINAFKEQGKPEILVYRRTEKPLVSIDNPQLDQKREQYERVEAFFASFANADGSIRQGYNRYTTPDHFREQFESHLRALIVRLLEKPQQAAMRDDSVVSTKLPLWQGSPFPGLRAFTRDDVPIFFGRGKETDGLVRKVADSRFVAVVGASGSGKSSLVGAGLLPRLAAPAIEGSKDWAIIHFTPGEVSDNPFMALAVRLAPMLLKHGWNTRQLAEELRIHSSNLDKLCTLALAGKPDWAEVLLFIDQFEELFTVVDDDEIRETFIEMLAEAAHSKRIRTVVTLRADFYHKCVEWPQLADLLRTGSYPLASPEPGALYEMITRPAARAGLEFEEDLAEIILIDTGKNPGSLPLLAYALDELYRARNGQGKLTRSAYDIFGGVQGAIGTRAEETFKVLDLDAQAALPDIFRHLVEVNEGALVTRQRARLTDIARTAAAVRLVTALTNARLLVQSRDEKDQAVVEVAHEALFRSWPNLVRWIEDELDDLRLLRQVRLAAREWDRMGRHPAYLWPDERLKPVYAMRDRLQPELEEGEREFIRLESERLIQELENTHPIASHARRQAISQRLRVIGDTRPGVGLRPDNLPNIEWCNVSGGRIKLEGNVGIFEVPPFYIAKYPITYIQFQAFVDDPRGYNQDKWWQGIRKSEVKDHNQRLKFANYPCENVRWWAAVAFCNWLTARYASSPSSLPSTLFASERRFIIRLPTEWEWQQAANGGNSDYFYPWGNESDSMRANTQESGLNETVAVGMYPQGASPVGALDMIGNVREWCLNEYDTAGNVRTNSDVPRAIRGGSFAQTLARLSFRLDQEPNYRFDDFIGFRVVYASECI